ncbi:uncharacterized protein GGS22DRAFT_113821 [Annulohypoxylon maeteangense]|uniref:uncharacterized protein n=1 Tax=Annulohypoxylon maeteangense TaxID=1927788 RepID=UPI00200786A8|nr:uncharacterized protein GGS22DRAFT_113821 [Annulohypoxylon maeteangense]KAI0886458.1 hypothetical protein GGS22DRAFT_113821 [Annulohypoxylon maeteangense]
MKYSVAIFALFSTLAMAELKKVPRSEKSNIVSRQAGAAQVQTAAMASANGDIIPFDTAGVYKASTDSGL